MIIMMIIEILFLDKEFWLLKGKDNLKGPRIGDKNYYEISLI